MSRFLIIASLISFVLAVFTAVLPEVRSVYTTLALIALGCAFDAASKLTKLTP
jgi:hypothetical protein